MGGDSTRANTPVPRPQSAMGSARGDNGGGVKVVVRTRPANQFELKEDGNKVCFEVASSETCMLEVTGKNEPYTFTFDNVFGQHSTQIEVFRAAGIPTVDNVLSGFNSTIFAYGQTGAGKTHTMLGVIKSAELRGLTPRVFEYLFERIAEEQATVTPPPEYKVVCSNLEIYNETITDLLQPGSTNLPLRNDTKLGSGTYVDGLKEVVIKSTAEALDLMEQGTNSRTVSATNANLTSSRSHCVFTCVITRKHKQPDGSENSRVSRLNLVDLAGSERAKVSDGKDAQTLKEGCNINKSLTCLGRVIKELVDAQRKGGKVHVPYRDSKLTALLQESLGGNARTTIIAGVSPMYSASIESLSTLQFVQRAKHIKNKAKANEQLKMDPKALQLEVLKLRGQIEDMKKKGFAPVAGDVAPVSTEPDAQTLEQIQELEDKLEAAFQHRDRAEQELEEARQTKDEAEARNGKLQTEISILRNLKTELQGNINQMMDQFNGWQSKIKEAEEISKKVFAAERAALREEIEIGRRKIEEQDVRKQEMDGKILELQQTLENSKADLDEMRASNADLAKKLDISNEDVDRKKLEIQKLTQDCTDAAASLKLSEAKCDDLDQRLVAAQATLQDRAVELQKLQSELDRRRAQIEGLEGDKAMQRQQIDDLENAKADLEKKIKETEMTVQQLEREKRKLEAEIECLQQSRAALEKASEDLRAQISHLNRDLRDCESEMQDLKCHIKDECHRADALEAKVSNRESTIADLESNLTLVTKTLDGKETELGQLNRHLADTENRLQAAESQRTSLEAQVAHYVEKATDELQQQLEEKEDEMQRLQASFEMKLKQREEKLTENAKYYDAERKRLVEAHQLQITELQSNIEGLKSERERKLRQHRDEVADLERKYKSSVDGYEERLEENEKRYTEQFEVLQADLRRKDGDMRETKSRFNAQIAALTRDLQEKTQDFELEKETIDKSANDALFREKQEANRHMRSLNDEIQRLEREVHEKEDTVAYLKKSHGEAMHSTQERHRKETMHLKRELQEQKDTLEAANHACSLQLEAMEHKLEETKKSLKDEITYKDGRIQILEDQLGEREDRQHQLEDYNCALHRYSQLNSAMYGVFEGIENILSNVIATRPSSVASSYEDRYETYLPRLSYEYDHYARYGADSALARHGHSDFAKETLCQAQV